MHRLHRRESAWSSQPSNVVSPPVLLRSGNNLTHERLSWARLKSPFVIIHAADLRLRGRHHRSVFGFSAASTRLFFFFNWPLCLSRVCLDSAKCSIYFSCWAASIFCNMHTHMLLHMPPYNTHAHTAVAALSFFSSAFAELSIIVHYSSNYVQSHSYCNTQCRKVRWGQVVTKSIHCHCVSFPLEFSFMWLPP